MRDYTKQNKAVFLSDGRCVFEEDALKYEEQQKQREELIASKEIPVVRGATYCGATYSNAATRYFVLPNEWKVLWYWTMSNTGYQGEPHKGADDCPDWKKK